MENKILTKEFNKYVDQLYNLDKINVEVYTEFKKAFFAGSAIVIKIIIDTAIKEGMDKFKIAMESLRKEMNDFALNLTTSETRGKNG